MITMKTWMTGLFLSLSLLLGSVALNNGGGLMSGTGIHAGDGEDHGGIHTTPWSYGDCGIEGPPC